MDLQQKMDDILGFYVTRDESTVGGTGVFIRTHLKQHVQANQGETQLFEENQFCVQKGQLVGLYPGTLYLPYQPIFLQSIANSFIFRCIDGIHLDGNDKRLSKIIFRSCCGRDKIGFFPAADDTWLTTFPLNPLNIGQYINNQSAGHPSNVAYQELTIPASFLSPEKRRFFPNLWYSLPSGIPIGDVPLRLVTIVATRDIKMNEELFSDYFTMIY